MKNKKIPSFVYFTTAFIYILLFLAFYMFLWVGLHAWFRFDTRVTNTTANAIEITPIAQSSYGTRFILQKNGWFPVTLNHSYEAVLVPPGKTIHLVWDWDDQTLNGFRLKRSDGRAFYYQVDFRPANQCCYGSDDTYAIDESAFFKSSPEDIEALGPFLRSDRWMSYFSPNISALIFWSLLLLPAFLLIKKGLRTRPLKKQPLAY